MIDTAVVQIHSFLPSPFLSSLPACQPTRCSPSRPFLYLPSSPHRTQTTTFPSLEHGTAQYCTVLHHHYHGRPQRIPHDNGVISSSQRRGWRKPPPPPPSTSTYPSAKRLRRRNRTPEVAFHQTCDHDRAGFEYRDGVVAWVGQVSGFWWSGGLFFLFCFFLSPWFFLLSGWISWIIAPPFFSLSQFGLGVFEKR